MQLTTKQYKILKRLDEMVLKCEDCSLCKNGRAKPYWTSKSKYIIVGEAPGKNEVISNIPFVGAAGKKLWEIMESYGYFREEFLIINSVNCRPVNGNRNGKPNNSQMEKCRKWIEYYIKTLKPEKMIILGNYSLFTILNESGIMDKNGESGISEEFSIPYVCSVHPAMMIYRGNEGKQMMKKSIERFSVL